MRVGGHRIREHVGLLWPLFIFIALVWLLRMVLSAMGLPPSVPRFFSVTAAGALAVLLAVLLIHFRRFGGYTNVVVSSLLLNAWSQLLIVLAIVFSALTGIENVYTLPEFSIPSDGPRHLRHIYGHLTFMTGLGTLMGAGMGCLLLWFIRMIVPLEKPQGKKNGRE